MKLTKVQNKIDYSIRDLVGSKCFDKTSYSSSYGIRRKIHNEIRTPNEASIDDMQIRILNNLKNAIN